MNPKLQKLEKDIAKTKEKISELQTKLTDMESQKTDIENTEYINIARTLDIPPDKFEALVRQLVTSMDSGNPANYTQSEKQEETAIEIK